MAVLARVLAHGAWELDDVQARHAADPGTFGCSGAQDLDALEQ